MDVLGPSETECVETVRAISVSDAGLVIVRCIESWSGFSNGPTSALGVRCDGFTVALGVGGLAECVGVSAPDPTGGLLLAPRI